MSKRPSHDLALVVLAGVSPALRAGCGGAAAASKVAISLVDHHGRLRAGASPRVRRRLGQGRAVSAAAEAIARNPSAAGDIRGALILGLVLIESLVIYVLLISLILFFLKPFGK